MARVVIENLTKTFTGPKRELISAVNNLNLVVEDREFLVLVGPSGCGKTSTLRLLAGLEESTTGTVSIDGKVINQIAPKDRDIAMVFQHHALYPHLTAYQNMAFGLEVRKLPRQEIEKRVKEASELLDLKDCLSRKPEALSGGQRQRVALGRAIVRKPKLFLFDEPLSNLDAPMRAQMRMELRKLHAQIGTTVIFVTHDQSEAMALGDRIAVMKTGVLQQADTPPIVYNMPANLFVAGFIGSPAMNFVRGNIEPDQEGVCFRADDPAGDAGTFKVKVERPKAERLKNLIGKKAVLGIRPEHIQAQPLDAQSGTAIKARVNLVEPMGPETYLYASAGTHPFILRIPPGQFFTREQPVSLVFDLSRAHFFDAATERAIV
jgi:multiple sugar transport system ATP-binding protein